MIWWNNELNDAVKKRRKALRKLKKLPVENSERPRALREFQLARALARKTINESKADSWKRFCESFTPNTNIKLMWENYGRLCGKIKRSDISLIIDGEHISDPNNVANILADKFEENSADRFEIDSISSNDDYDDYYSEETHSLRSTNPDSPLDEDFSIAELMDALKAAKGQSVGDDLIGYPMINNLSMNGKFALLKAYNDIWAEGRFPED